VTLSTAVNLGRAAMLVINQLAMSGGGAPSISKTVDRTTTTVDATIRTVDRA
jgi:hypothetical protein